VSQTLRCHKARKEEEESKILPIDVTLGASSAQKARCSLGTLALARRKRCVLFGVRFVALVPHPSAKASRSSAGIAGATEATIPLLRLRVRLPRALVAGFTLGLAVLIWSAPEVSAALTSIAPYTYVTMRTIATALSARRCT